MWLKIDLKVASTCAGWINIYLNQHWQWFIPRSTGRGRHSSLDDSSNLISIKSLTFLVSLGKCCPSTTTQVSNIFSNWVAFTHNYTHTQTLAHTHSSTLRAFTSLSAIRDSHEGTPLDKVWRGRCRGNSLGRQTNSVKSLPVIETKALLLMLLLHLVRTCNMPHATCSRLNT